ncbi:MAG: hypothetical protein ABSF24_06635 [Candidatus Bathyarchaeia archaeon]
MPGVKLDDDFYIEKTAEGYVLLDPGGKAVLGPFTLTDKSIMKKIEERTGASEKAVESALAELAVLSAEETKKTKADKEKRVKKKLKDSGLTVEGSFEAIYSDDKPCFLLKNGESFSIVESLDSDGEKVFPKEARNVPYEPYGYFQGSVPNREDLFWRVRQEFDTWIDVEPIWKDVLTALVILTYLQEKLRTVPYIFLFGDNESGKSTVLQLLKFLCYRPMYGVTIPAADLYGYLEDSDSIGCILEDEVQGINKDTDKIKIYKAGYKAGAVVPRTLITQNDRIIKYYKTFSFKACASEQIPQVKGFAERFLFIPMVEGFPLKEWADATEEDLHRLHTLRDILLKWRMLSRDWDLPSLELQMKGRLKELWKPILQVTHGLPVYEDLFKFVETQKNERLSNRQNTLEGHIVKVVVDLHNEMREEKSNLPFTLIWEELVHDLNGKLDDRKPHVMDTSEFFEVTKNKVGYRLREVLSGRTTVIKDRDSDGKRVSVKAYVFDSEKLRRVAKKYGYEVSTKLPSLLSSESALTPESMDKTTLNNVEKEPCTPQELGRLSNSVDSQKEPSGLAVEDSSISKNPLKESVVDERLSNSVTTEHTPGEEERVCGKCASWHKPGCSYPEGEPSCVTPLNRYAADCKDFIAEEAKA